MSESADSCATEVLKERVDRYDTTVAQNPQAVKARHHIADMLKCLCQSLERYHVSPDILKKFNELEDAITELECQDILAIAGSDMDVVRLAIQLGLMYEKLLQSSHRQDGTK